MGKKPKVGGQAVIEGVMMRGPKKYAVAIKKYNGNVVLDKGEVHSIKDKVKILNLFILRGIVAFFESLVLGMKTLIFSADYFDMEEKSQMEAEIWLTVVVIFIKQVNAAFTFLFLSYDGAAKLYNT